MSTIQELWNRVVHEAVVRGDVSGCPALIGTKEQLSAFRESVIAARKLGGLSGDGDKRLSEADVPASLSEYRVKTGLWESLTGLKWPLRLPSLVLRCALLTV